MRSRRTRPASAVCARADHDQVRVLALREVGQAARRRGRHGRPLAHMQAGGGRRRPSIGEHQRDLLRNRRIGTHDLRPDMPPPAGDDAGERQHAVDGIAQSQGQRERVLALG